MRKLVVLALAVCMFLPVGATAQTEAEAATITGHRVTHAEIRFCRLAGTGAPFVACLHTTEGHVQGQPGHLWTDYQRQARLLRRYITGLIRPTCSERVSCERLVRLLAPRYGIEPNGALRVMLCESGGNPRSYNPSSGASGLFQQLARYWPGRAAAYGFAGASPFDGYANASVSLGMIRDTGGYSHWVCQP